MISPRLGKILYAFLFLVAVPALLVSWAMRTREFVTLDVPLPPSAGIVIALSGFLLLVAGMLTILVYGGGLPMNAYPPPRFVTRGIYRYLAHPIYVGFTLLCAGTSIAFDSSSGFWLVTPFVALGCTAIVQGYERHDLVERFGRAVAKPLLSIPADEPRRPFLAERVSVYVLVFLPWLVLYEGVVVLGNPPDAIVAYFPFEDELPVLEWAEFFYASTYLFLLLVPVIATSAQDLRAFSVSGLAAIFVIILCFLAFPFVAPPRPFTAQHWLGELLQWERTMDSPAAAFPSFHVVWALLAARMYAKSIPSLKVVWWGWALSIVISCIATGMHALVDVVGACLISWPVIRIAAVWRFLRGLSERIANSWKEWVVGPVRIINHGAYAAVGTFTGISIIGLLLGPASLGSVLIAALSGLIISALWAQFIEGSPSLLRPYGFYGGILGVILGSFVGSLFGTDVALLLGGFSVAAPWIQAAGRLRCLVQGCCHGREAPPQIGIRYTHPRSRVTRLAGLADVPIHPTPLYSILWNIVTGVILARLWSLSVPPLMIAGLYLMLNGLGRFVEESYRGEPQTPVIGKLRLYQIAAIVSMVVGGVFTSLGSSVPTPAPILDLRAILAGTGFGIVTFFALGVDFPRSNKRFARLA